MNSMNGMNRRNIIINNTINRLKEIKGSSGSGNGNTKISVG